MQHREYLQSHAKLWEHGTAILKKTKWKEIVGLYLYPWMDLANEDIRLKIINAVLEFYIDIKIDT